MKYKTDCWILNELLGPHNKASKRVRLNQSAALNRQTLSNFQMSIILNIEYGLHFLYNNCEDYSMVRSPMKLKFDFEPERTLDFV